MGESDVFAEMGLSFSNESAGFAGRQKGNRAMTQELFHIGGVFVLTGILFRLREIVFSFEPGRRKRNGDCSDQ